MAANSISQVNHASIMANYHKDGETLLRLSNALTVVNDMLADAPLREANGIDTDQVARVTALPVPYWHKLGEGLTSTVGHIQQGTEGIGMLRNQWRGNKEIVDKQASPSAYVDRQETLFLESMNQEIQNTAVYGDSGTAPEEFDGLDVRYASLADGSVFNNGASDSGNMTSVYLIQWDEYDCGMIFPKGSPGGLRRIPKGVHMFDTVNDAQGTVGSTKAKAEFYVTNYEWDTGLCVQDTRRIKRVANVHKTRGNANQIDIDVVIEARNHFKTSGTVFLYAPLQVKTQIQILAKDAGNVHYPPDMPFGKPVPYVLDMPVRQCDALVVTETTVS